MLSVDSVAWVGVYRWGTPKSSNSVPPVMPTLTELRVRASKAAEKPYRLYDERGLFMLVTTAGGRLRRFKYRIDGVREAAHPRRIPRCFFEASARSGMTLGVRWRTALTLCKTSCGVGR